MQDQKIKVSSEVVYILATVFLALSVAMIALSGFGLSMIVAPAYLFEHFLSFFLSFYQPPHMLILK